MTAAERTLVFWVPDWPIQAFLRDQDDADKVSDPAIALIAQHRVAACSPAARAEGVRTGLREREAQSRCPRLAVHPHDPEVDRRRFAPIATALERLVPGIEVRRPGLCAMRARGPARYYGSEEQAADALLALAADLDLPDARVGIADGLFAAEQAVRATADSALVTSPSEGVRIVASGSSAAFLSPLPVSRAASESFTTLLVGLGIRTLGALAALPEEAVQQRFGAEGVAVHRRARAAHPTNSDKTQPRTPGREFSVEIEFEPPIDTAEQLGFACAAIAERFVAGFTAERLVCTALRVELTDDIGARHEREWLHPRHFTAADTVGRIRWQAAAIARASERTGAGVTRVRVTPTHTDRAAAHEPGLWSNEPDARVHHHLSRVQSRLGHTGVGTIELAGGRLLAERQRFVPWSTTRAQRPGSRASAAGPWPGALTGPTPSQVFPEPLSAELLDGSGHPVRVNAEDLLDSAPHRLQIRQYAINAPVLHWSTPWVIRERWWQSTAPRFRLQVQLAGDDAWLLFQEGEHWFAEGHYD
ncbi:DNA polymerase Y family protein [Leucobacter viscericola]|uniref:DNA polymerase Y family protein n=1 Tax=Leucobacter viscericola TaxID=2714935 RepID=A0A6G7XCZ2_9MICO|nr:DNA polymerase Y family protein [Leucobacter viscericola]QIK62241.1 DNA polymerase Y family protein [Leucobacter viscericola]